MSPRERTANGGRPRPTDEGQGMPKSKPLYSRAPSPELVALLKPGKILSLLTNKALSVKALDTCVDVHFRSNDCIHVYCGLTRVIDLRLKDQRLKLTAHHTYKKQGWEGFFGCWPGNDPSLARELRNYLDRVVVNCRYVKAEGSVQLVWARVTEPWIPFDREVRLENWDHSPTGEVNDAYRELKEIYREHSDKKGGDRWAKPEKTAVKIDQLAIDPDGHLVLLELKSEKTREYFAPFQLLQYVWQWYNALQDSPKLLEQINGLIKARVEVGLMPRPKASLTPQIRAAVCLGRDERSPKVKKRYGIVLDIVNKHRPCGVPPFETWEYDRGARRVS